MSGNTPTFGFLYPTSGDRWCDSPTFLATFAQQVEDALVLIDADIERLTVVPFGRVSAPAPAPVFTSNPSNTIPAVFTTIDVDTAGIVDISSSTTFPITTAGPDPAGSYEWSTGAWMQSGSTGAPGNTVSLTTKVIPTDPFPGTTFFQRDNNNGTINVIHGEQVNPNNGYLGMLPGFTGTSVPATIPLNAYRMYAFWVSDLS